MPAQQKNAGETRTIKRWGAYDPKTDTLRQDSIYGNRSDCAVTASAYEIVVRVTLAYTLPAKASKRKGGGE